MDALGFAAVVDGNVDVRTVSSDSYNARRQALFWVFGITTRADTHSESYVNFLWQRSVAIFEGRDRRTIEIRGVEVVALDTAPPDAPEASAGETPAQLVARLTPRSTALENAKVGADQRDDD